MERSSSARLGVGISPLSSVGPGVQLPPPAPSESSAAESEESTAATQAACYAWLWNISGDQPSSENENDSENTADYCIVAIAGAMYLILSIAAADVWCGCALILEGRGPGFTLFTRRRVFGVFLLATFLTLVGASIRVLFNSAHDDVQLVLGAAAVLFIADVDEKAMSVLKNVSGEWVLFWVLEVIGLSFVLALFAVEVTGNTEALDNHDETHSCIPWTDGGCYIFTWYFVLTVQPISVTVVAVLLTCVISRKTSSIAGRVFFPRSRKEFVITLFVLCWVAQGSLWVVHWVASAWVGSISGACAVVFVLIFYRLELTRAKCAKTWRRGVPQGVYRLLASEGLRISLRFVLAAVHVATSPEYTDVFHYNFYDGYYIVDIAGGALYFIIYAWLMNGLRLADLPLADVGSNVALLTFLRSMILGWGLSEGYFAMEHWVLVYTWKLCDLYPKTQPGVVLAVEALWLMWHIIVGTSLWGGTAGARGIAYWAAMSLILRVFVDCVSTWVYAGMDKTVK